MESGTTLPPDVEWVTPLPPDRELAPVTHVRGTLLATSRDQVRAAGRFEEYEKHLPSQARVELDAAHVTTWFPIEIAHHHFAALDRVAITESQVKAMTEEVSRKLSGAFMQSVATTLRTSGLDPWSVVPFYSRVWRRLFVGGALAVAKLGPKDARVVIAGQPLIQHRYLRVGLSRHLVIGVEFLLAKRPYVREVALDPGAGRVEYLLQWV